MIAFLAKAKLAADTSGRACPASSTINKSISSNSGIFFHVPSFIS
ncbi:hypothetical protein BMETH_2203_0 [methanotrophic bacterial endosymbiont of Bathymodiolus sp.]|nr:hypothetical protein BMETH_2203_0 [methanotrophic bacterial endosymbiont of Bathymodiolus sp.]